MLLFGPFVLAVMVCVVIAGPNCDDIAIIGAGMGGSYAAYRLRDKGLKVSLYEYTGRIGGRAHTANFDQAPKVNLDMGPMRFNPDVHLRVNRAVEELGIATRNFRFGSYAPPEVYYARGNWLEDDDVAEKAPYILKERLSPAQIKWRIITNNTNFDPETDSDTLELRRSLISDDGVKLSDQSVSTFYSKYATTEEYALLKDLARFEEFSDLPADMNVGLSNPYDDDGKTYVTKGMVNGFQSLPIAMVNAFTNFSSDNKLRLNRKLIEMKKRKNGGYRLEFIKPNEPGQYRECASTVILASTLSSLQELDFEPFQSGEVKDILDNAMEKQTAWKIFLGFDSKWWRKSTTPYEKYILSTTPLGGSYDFGTDKDNGYYVMLSYGDFKDALPIWREVFKQGSSFPTAENDDGTLTITDVTANLCRKYLAEIYNLSIDEVPPPKQAVGVLWEGEPIDAAWYTSKQGYNSTYVSEKMIKPIDDEEVYIASAIYNIVHYSWWSEGALQNAERVLELIGYPVEKLADNDNNDGNMVKPNPLYYK